MCSSGAFPASNCRAGASHCRAMLVHGSPVALERSETPHVASAAAQAALVQRNRSVTAVSLLSSSLGAPVDPASFPADGFPSMAVSTAGSAAGGGPGLPVAAIAGIAAGAAALALAVCRAPPEVAAPCEGCSAPPPVRNGVCPAVVSPWGAASVLHQRPTVSSEKSVLDLHGGAQKYPRRLSHCLLRGQAAQTAPG